MRSRNTFVCTGRYGDIVGILPAMWAKAQSGETPVIVVAEKFASILDGVSYVEPLVWHGEYDDVGQCAAWVKQNRPMDRVQVCQSYHNPTDTRRLCPTYHEENWRLAGMLPEFGQHPLVFDRRDKAREMSIWEPLMNDRPTILVATQGKSAPFKHGSVLLEMIRGEFGRDFNVLDLDTIKVERIYDLIGAMDRAMCLVTVDSVCLHLSNASTCPVIALIGDDPWVHSVPPPQTTLAVRYNEYPQREYDVLREIHRIIEADCEHRFIVHVWDGFGQEARHHEAQKTWESAYGDEDVIQCTDTIWGESSLKISDPRALPLLNDLLARAVKSSTSDHDVVIFSNSDVSFSPGLFTKFKRQSAIWGAFSLRRVEPGLSRPHPGREVFGFRVDWLKKHLPDLPKLYLGTHGFDLVLAALIRKERRVISTKSNMSIDFPPCELVAGPCQHEPHASFWSTPEAQRMPANIHNISVARAWCAANCPTLRF